MWRFTVKENCDLENSKYMVFDKFIYNYNFSEKINKTELLYRIKAEDLLLGSGLKILIKKDKLHNKK
ncbi:hypothetical protein CPAST_c17950 [Clostridium pasteurianum DSM 525 = ATCC 6013]|uniref:Uncharacterized protein n=1 Tax=Clostridium pasteurianum DSM 525 = ATCC 6013 TaxID=1262449 RepID=A0A0H3J9N7_CLOPA|nr:hypothetical protein [Clostridium pasteurianum]AJA47865.1 hypothetical protein CPAST_c17950 [Clostridium pasteurianum DSM 525 = ATCC 6013]AJA51853.1 hypothetical protein CLPA_c17950 [Clostridium pasteurianum DSM 525 = ATCC 6013]AOZ75156.1 hypothetical protein AQ983_08710 [Clostridium pasteurianum DSM 525 = ATCC 6013]AOZ78951.1 hypothetical protein AQ984_08700 [Clostridium pasteurianum]ELP59768.1 hypothetical protein F502_07883 [Clostridium pasteurianum DSM 525 = ATCC 6013]